MRIAIAGILHETSTFVDWQTTLRDFQHDRGIIRGAEMLERFRGTNVCTGGFIDALEERGVEPVPLLRASAFPGGLVNAGDYVTILGEMLDRLREAELAGPVDGVLLDLHGAMVVDGIDDADGDVISAFRKVLGTDRPIVVTFDLHGNHTRARVEAADAVVGFDTFPHVDMAERGREAADLIVRTVRREIRPVGAIHHVPLFWSTARQVTAHPPRAVGSELALQGAIGSGAVAPNESREGSPMDEVMHRVHEIECRPGILSMTLATGFPWADVPDVGTSVIVIADGDRDLAQRTADEFGAWIWENRERWCAPPVSVQEALAAGEAIGRYPIILADHADNTGGGSPGDSTEVLRTLLELGLEDVLLLYMVDPDAARTAHAAAGGSLGATAPVCSAPRSGSSEQTPRGAAGVGATIHLELGGRSAPVQGPPVECDAEVIALATGEFAYDGPMFAGLTGSMGTSAWLKIDGVNVVVVTAREQPFDMAFARSLGIDCRRMKYIALKSAAPFRAAFEPIAGSIHNVDAAGIHSHDFSTLTYVKRRRDAYHFRHPSRRECG